MINYDEKSNFRAKMQILSSRDVGGCGDVYRRLSVLADRAYDNEAVKELFEAYRKEYSNVGGILNPERVLEFVSKITEVEAQVDKMFASGNVSKEAALKERERQEKLIIEEGKTKSLDEAFDRVKQKIEYCELQYNMNINRLSEFLNPEQVDTFYFAAINRSWEMLDVIRDKIDRGVSVSDYLGDTYQLCELVIEMLECEDVFTFNTKGEEIARRVNDLKKNYLNIKKIG